MRNIDGEKPRSIAGSLLVAHPDMLDPNFRRAVLFISAHDPDDGALGVIINRPLEKNVADLVTEAPPEGLAGVPVFFGGPVGKNQLVFAAFEWRKGEGLKLNHDVGTDEASARAGQDPDAHEQRRAAPPASGIEATPPLPSRPAGSCPASKRWPSNRA